jgi:putative ABC transport system permease protein
MSVMSRTPLGWKILVHKPRRLAVSLAGIALAVALMFTQDGFREAMFDSQTELIRHLDGDLFLINRLKYLMNVPEPFPSRRLAQVRGAAGVEVVLPLYLLNDRPLWRNPGETAARPIRVLAFDPAQPVLNLPGLAASADDLNRSDTVLFDDRSRAAFGSPRRGSRAELAGRDVEVVGTFSLGTDFLSDGTVIMSHRNYPRFFPNAAGPQSVPDKVEVGVIRLQAGADLRAVQEALRDELPGDVAVLTKRELMDLELRYWQSNAAIGYVFTLGMVVGFVIGTVVCYQVLYSNVSNLLPQFATLKAMGFTDGFLVAVVFQQGLFLAVLAFIPAAIAAQLLFSVLSQVTGLVMSFTVFRVGLILILTIAMCTVSGAVAVRRVLSADPAEVFK